AGLNRATDPVASFDITLMDETGRVCIEVEGFTIHKLEGTLALDAVPHDLEFEDEANSNQLSAAEERLAHSLSQGIRPEEGAAVFGRALAAGLPQIIVSSLDLLALVALADRADAAPPEGQSFARPDLDSDYIEPRNDIERVLTGFWQDLLGVGQVGVEDDFFALGGHSLIAVRLFAKVRKAFAVDFPISVLFEAPTVAACAALIEERIGPQDNVAKPSAPKRRFKYLVPMHRGDDKTRTPIFMVAGMFGNILNLRYMANLLGSDRQFYGLQAKGLFGDDQPHDNLTQAAADYITEIRQVQPHGPYILGGYSGGGLTAWEIARLLEAEGEVVANLALLDTPLPMRPVLSRPDKVLIKLAEFREKGVGYAWEWARNRYAWKLQQYRARKAGPLQTIAAAAFHDLEIEAAFRAALPQLQITPREGSVVLYRPPLDRKWQVTQGNFVSAAKEYVFEDNDWAQFASSLQVVEVPGDHDSMVLEPNVRVLVAHLRGVTAGVDAARCGRMKPKAEPGFISATAAE
ncbi:MAG: thioesterase domain-containing protein/acyl carrier protein, partial [Pseudorhodobacter sp.]